MAAEPGDRPDLAVTAALDRLAPSPPVGVALSGGGDSTALLLIAARWAAARGAGLAAATVDHGLRPEARAEAEAAGRLAARLGAPHTILSVGPLAGPGNLPALARAARTEALAGWARAGGLGAVLLGHTLDDQAETLLMRLARGSGVEGLAAMAEDRTEAGVRWLRPMLGVRRAALRDWLGAEGETWSEDPTNEDPRFDRVRARRALARLAPLGITPEGLAETAGRLARQRRVLEAAMADLAAQARRWGALGEARLALAPLAAVPRDTALRLLAETLRAVAGAPYRPRFRALEALHDAARAPGAAPATLLGCLVVPEPAADRLLICREPAAVAAPSAAGPGEHVWDGRWQVALPDGAPDCVIGALGPEGRRALARAAEAGDWDPPEAWARAPAPVQETVPAVFASAGAPAPLAVPAAAYAATGHAWAGAVSAMPLAGARI